MNQSEIDELLKKSKERRERKAQLEETMSHFKESDFNQNLTMTGFKIGGGPIWLASDRTCDCTECGIGTKYYKVSNSTKIYVCDACRL